MRGVEDTAGSIIMGARVKVGRSRPTDVARSAIPDPLLPARFPSLSRTHVEVGGWSGPATLKNGIRVSRVSFGARAPQTTRFRSDIQGASRAGPGGPGRAGGVGGGDRKVDPRRRRRRRRHHQLFSFSISPPPARSRSRRNGDQREFIFKAIAEEGERTLIVV